MEESEKSCLDGRLFWRVSLEGRACSTAKREQEIPAESLSGICLGVTFPS